MLELYSKRYSMIHSMNARVKVIFTLAFVLAVSLTPFNAWPAFILFLSLTLSVAIISRLGIGYILKRAFLVLPFVLAAVPLIFTGPSPYLTFNLTPELKGYISLEGVERFVGIAIKSWLSIQTAILLASTTRFPDLLTALAQLKVPQLFVAIIGLMWRYLFVISDEAIKLMHARASRSSILVGSKHPGKSVFWRAKVTGGMAGSLFLRSLDRSDRVYAAMLSRGYSGELPERDHIPFSRSDRWILSLGSFILTLIWLLGFLTGG